MIRDMRADDSPEVVARLIYDTDAFLFPFVFGSFAAAGPLLTHLVSLDDNSFSHRFIRVHTGEEGTIDGLSIGFGGKEKPSDRDYMEVMKGWAGALTSIRSLLLYPILSPPIRNSWYLQNLSVAPEVRGKGIGRQLLADAYETARGKGYQSMSLDVSLSNPGAQRLYRSEGFIPIRKRRMWGVIPVTFWCEKTL